MISLASFLTESAQAENAFIKAKTISKYITSARQKQRFEDACDLMAKAAKDKLVYNAPFKDAYSYGLSRGLDYAWETLRQKHDEEIKQREDSIDLWTLEPVKIKKFQKALASSSNAEIKQFIDAISGIPEAVKVVKTYIQKGRPPKQPDPTKEVVPMASREASKEAQKFFTQAVASFKEDFHRGVLKQKMAAFDKIKNAKTTKDIPDGPDEKTLATIVFIKRETRWERGGKAVSTLELKPGAEKLVRKVVDDTVEGIIADFVSKNTSKVAKLFEKKGSPKVHKILRTSVRNNVIENTMHFEFEDGSMFDINTQVIYKVSPRGTFFAQFPTRFTNVKYADGTKMSMPSEAKIAKEL